MASIHTPNSFFITISTDILAYSTGKGPVSGLEMYIARPRTQLAGNTWQMHDHDSIEQASQLRTLRSSVTCTCLSVSLTRLPTHSLLTRIHGQEGATSTLAEVGEVGCMVGGRIQHQDFFLETLKEREQMAKKLHGMAV